MVSLPLRKWSFGVVTIALSFVFIFGLRYQAPISARAQNVCIGLGGWPCGYMGPFTGNYFAGYATLGCTPMVRNSTCVVPQVAIETSYLIISNASYVIDWANGSFQSSNRLADGSTISVSGKLDPIFYNKTEGSTYMIYYSNAKAVWNPQPRLQIQNATLTNQSASLTCTTAPSFTVSLSWNGLCTMPMIPAGASYTVSNITQRQTYTAGGMDIPISAMVLASFAVIMAGTLAFVRKRSKEDTSSTE